MTHERLPDTTESGIAAAAARLRKPPPLLRKMHKGATLCCEITRCGNRRYFLEPGNKQTRERTARMLISQGLVVPAGPTMFGPEDAQTYMVAPGIPDEFWNVGKRAAPDKIDGLTFCHDKSGSKYRIFAVHDSTGKTAARLIAPRLREALKTLRDALRPFDWTSPVDSWTDCDARRDVLRSLGALPS